MDVVRDGPADADKLLIVSSACHGSRAIAAAACRCLPCTTTPGVMKARAQGVAVLYIHALNPHGFSHIRRTTHENVDLNRNFHDFSRPLPVNEAYREVEPLVAAARVATRSRQRGGRAALYRHLGEAAWQAAISQGQHEFAQGLFFGGTGAHLEQPHPAPGAAPAWQPGWRIGWIDLHTGLGPSGHGERIYAGRDDAAAIARARQWWDGHGATPVTSIYDGIVHVGLPDRTDGTAIYDECPQAQYTGIAMEYGTLPILEVMQALRAEHWLHIHPEACQRWLRRSRRRCWRPSTPTPMPGKGRSSPRRGRPCSRQHRG